jgi:site-specific recombinase XerD
LYSKGGKLRRIYIPKKLQEEALAWFENKNQNSGFIFLNKYGARITTRGISGQLKKLAVKYGINPAVIYPHSFRHRFAKSFLERCNDIAFLADLMGHESIETTRIYLRKTSTEQRTIVDSIVDW